MKNRQYQGVQLSKKESELIEWLQKGEHTWQDAFYIYKDRRTTNAMKGNGIKERSWFNRTLNRLHIKGLCKNIPYIMDHIAWRNPGIKASKANFVATTIQEVNLETQNFRRAI